MNYLRTSFEMTPADLEKILDACKPVPYMVIGGMPPASPQENANRAWAALGKRMGFDYMTVLPDSQIGDRFFTAVPSETDRNRDERLALEKEEAQRAEVARIEGEIKTLQDRLTRILDRKTP